ncbi:MAG: hypothetical protein ACOC83_00020 [Gemmatimonadota bacterium]
MPQPFFFTSMTRISDLVDRDFRVEPLEFDAWSTGDYVVTEVVTPSDAQTVELASGRMIEVAEGDLVIGALGRRHATLEATGTWERVEEDGRMELLTAAGLLGKCTSISPMIPSLTGVVYRGHLLDGDDKLGMDDFVSSRPHRSFETPTVLLVGTSMSAGKTTAARVIIRLLKQHHRLTVLGAKLTGAGRYRDVLAMKDAGADHIFDFMDAGLPSTVVSAEGYRERLRTLLSKMAAIEADVAVIESGASPLEPYNGATAIEEMQHAVEFTVLCSSDPYAIVGVMEAFGTRPDLVTGICTNTIAGVELSEELSGIRALNVRERSSHPELLELLEEHLDL